jgi:hypothetical protein
MRSIVQRSNDKTIPHPHDNATNKTIVNEVYELVKLYSCYTQHRYSHDRLLLDV